MHTTPSVLCLIQKEDSVLFSFHFTDILILLGDVIDKFPIQFFELYSCDVKKKMEMRSHFYSIINMLFLLNP